MSLRRSRSFFKLSLCPIFIWKRRRNSWSLSSCSWCRSSSGVVFLNFSACINSSFKTFYQPSSSCAATSLPVHGVARHQLGAQRQLVRRQPHGLSSLGGIYAFHLKQDLARPHHRHPVIGSALAFAHTGFSRLFGNGLVGKQPDPDLAAALDETRHGHAAGLDLPVGNVTRLQHL